MGGEGTIAGMIISIRNNGMLLRSLKNRKRAAWEHLKYPTKKDGQKLNSRKMTDQELITLRKELRRENKKEMIKLILIGVFMIVLATILFYYLFTALLS